MNTALIKDSIYLLKQLIQTPSFSTEEEATATLIQNWFEQREMPVYRKDNNIWLTNYFFDAKKPTILLNSHHDTVQPNNGYTKDPFLPETEEGKLYGLGSNDAGASLVALMACFTFFYSKQDLSHNLVFAGTAEEENSGEKGIRSLLNDLPNIDFAIVGEPTEMQMAIAEKGLLVIDALAKGKSGHVAHENTVNAIYEAIEDIESLQSLKFPKKSEFLGPVKISVSQINAGKQHNVIPSECHFVIDVRINEHYTNLAVFELLDSATKSELKARSFKHNSSGIDPEHPIVLAGINLGIQTYGSPTLSDQTNLKCPSLKIGPGKSERSHSADEFIYLSEIENGIHTYINLLKQIL